MTEQIISLTREKKIIAIVRGIAPEQGLQTAQALYDGGIRMIEVTFDQKNPNNWKNTTDMIRAIDAHFGGKVAVGAGTVTTPELVELAAAAGAKYIISPDANEDVIRRTVELHLVSIPGVMTPTEIMAAHRAGADFVKLFPAGSLGAGYLKAIKAPISHIDMLVVGGIDEKNIADFLKVGAAGAGIGGNLVNKAWVEAGQFEKITEIARQLVAAAQ